MLLKCYKNAFFREKSAEIFVGLKKKQYLCTLFRRAYGYIPTRRPNNKGKEEEGKRAKKVKLNLQERKQQLEKLQLEKTVTRKTTTRKNNN